MVQYFEFKVRIHTVVRKAALKLSNFPWIERNSYILAHHDNILGNYLGTVSSQTICR